MFKENYSKGMHGESLVFSKLKNAGISVKWVFTKIPKGNPDFVTKDGKSIDVKIAFIPAVSKTGLTTWRFNCHHHAEKQTNIDFFIFVINPLIPPLVFVFPSELIPSKVFLISSKQLQRGKYDHFLENWSLIDPLASASNQSSIKKLIKPKKLSNPTQLVVSLSPEALRLLDSECRHRFWPRSQTLDKIIIKSLPKENKHV